VNGLLIFYDFICSLSRPLLDHLIQYTAHEYERSCTIIQICYILWAFYAVDYKISETLGRSINQLEDNWIAILKKCWIVFVTIPSQGGRSRSRVYVRYIFLGVNWPRAGSPTGFVLMAYILWFFEWYTASSGNMSRIGNVRDYLIQTHKRGLPMFVENGCIFWFPSD